jgi:protein SCO1
MKRIYTLLITSTLYFQVICAQNYLSNTNDSIEIGIIEHLGNTIPLDLTFQNENDSTVHLGDLINKPTIFTFVYFDCPGICSPLLDGVSDVIEKTDLVLGKDYQVITISFNYNDNPEKARIKKKNFIRKHSQTHQGSWMYLTGDSINIYKAVNAVGFKFKRAGFDYIHAAAIMVVSPKGKITRYLYGVTFLPLDVKMAIIESQKGLSRPTINRVLEFCYAYDPAGRRYVLDVLKITGSIILFIIVLFAATLYFKSKSRKKK